MRSKILIVFIMFASLNIYSQDRDIYNEVIDSALVSISRIIEADFVQDSIVIPQNLRIGFGNIFAFKVIFDSKTSYILTLQSVSESLSSEFGKQYRPFNFRKNLNFYRFVDYVQEYEKLPYEIFEPLYYNCKFLLLTYKKDEIDQGVAVYGEYKFSLSENDILEVVDKKIEILDEEKDINNKYNSAF